MQKPFISIVFLFFSLFVYSQNDVDSTASYTSIDYSRPREYIIADIQVTGVKYLQPGHLVTISGLSKGMKIQIPGTEITAAIKKYWKHGLFSDVKILVTKIEDGNAYLEIQLKEQPRMNLLEYKGIKKGEKDDLDEKINLKRGTQITNDILNKTSLIIKKHFKEKGFFHVDVNIQQKADTTSANLVNLVIDIKKNDRVKIEKIIFIGNQVYTTERLRRTFKKTKQIDINIFKGSKLLETEYKEDKKKLLEFYNKNGYRDAQIQNEKIVELNKKRINLEITIYEGGKYHIRKIDWIGNTKYPTDYLSAVLGIKSGEIYDKKQLEERLHSDEDAVTSVYMDNGYLFFSINAVEAKVENDSVDLEMRVYEGKQATLNNIFIKGNNKTNEHVVRRELYTRPGQLFSKSDIIRSVRELATLGHFNPETISPTPVPNQADGTVDIIYNLEERANDQLELSGGWGGYYGFMGTVRVKFSNFNIGKFFDPKSWRPVPSGNGQTLQLGVQTSGRQYQGYNITFVEPWFGGKKPNSFSVSLFHNRSRPSAYNSNSDLNQYFYTTGASVGLGKRLKWPDDYFSIYVEGSYQLYKVNNYSSQLANGDYNLLSMKFVLSRSSQDQMIYPRKGSSLSLGLQLTPPYSLINGKDYATMDPIDKYKNIEFHKWSFTGNWYTPLIQNLVLALHAEFGYLGFYNKDIGSPLFEKYDLGGDGLSGYDVSGTDVIGLRGYENGMLTPRDNSGKKNGNTYTRYFTELRYPFSLNPSATIYGLLFLEGGNAWQNADELNPFSIKRAAGIGIRAFLPMFGMLGVDWGWGFDTDAYGSPSHGQWHFVMGQQF